MLRSTHLLRLLGGALLLSTDVPADISRICRLADDVLEGAPRIASRRRCALVRKLRVNTGRELVNRLLDEAALCNTGAEEDGVDGKKDPAALLEQQRGADNAEPQCNLEHGYERHAAVVVLLDKLANSLGGAGRGGLGASWGRAGWGLDGRKQVGAHVGGNVEDGVDCKGRDGERDLAHEEPDECHD